MKNFVIKNKKYIASFIILFIAYYLLGYKMWNNSNFMLYLDSVMPFDPERVVGDLAIFNFRHYTQTTHPIFLIIFQPIYLLFGILIDKLTLIHLIQCFLSAASVIILYMYLKKLKIKGYIRILFCGIFAVSFSTILLSIVPETFLFAQFFLLLMHIYVLKTGEVYKKRDSIILIIFGILSFGITITNFMQFLFCLIYVLNKKKIKNIKIKFIILSGVSFFIATAIAVFQKILYWDTASYFFNFKEMLGMKEFIEVGDSRIENIVAPENSENGIQILKFFKVIAETILNGIYNVLYGNNIIELTNSLGRKNIMQYNDVYNLTNIAIVVFFLILVSTVFFIKNIKKDLYFLLLGCFLFNILFHTFWGRSEFQIYSGHYLFLMIILIALFINERKNKIYFVIMTLIFLTQIVFNINSIIYISNFVINNYSEKVIGVKIDKLNLMLDHKKLLVENKGVTSKDKRVLIYDGYVYIVSDSKNINPKITLVIDGIKKEYNSTQYTEHYPLWYKEGKIIIIKFGYSRNLEVISKELNIIEVLDTSNSRYNNLYLELKRRGWL